MENPAPTSEQPPLSSLTTEATQGVGALTQVVKDKKKKKRN